MICFSGLKLCSLLCLHHHITTDETAEYTDNRKTESKPTAQNDTLLHFGMCHSACRPFHGRRPSSEPANPWRQVFLLLVAEMALFMLLILPLPFSMRRKMFTYVAADTLAAALAMVHSS